MMRASNEGAEFLIVGLCAQWCGTCRAYQPAFEALAAEPYPNCRFVWVDIEDEADWVGDIDVENFPSVIIQRRQWVLFFGPLLPDINILKKLLETFRAQTAEESAVYATATPEREKWQSVADIRSMFGQ